jgi:thymidylate kinase
MLILVEGVPGAGKSSTARFPRDALAAEGRAVRWWYEEERGHPVYCFHDAATLAAVVADLNAGQHERVIAAALARWRRFAAETRTSDTVVILDGCLFGYLTWSLFPLAVPEAEIAAYVAAVERILAPCAPRLIYLRPSDLAATLAHVGRERGDGWLSRFTARATDNALDAAPAMPPREGMLAYWTAYRDLADRLFERSSLPRMAVAGAGEAWPEVRRSPSTST